MGRGGAGLVELAVELGELAGAAVRGGAADGRANVLVVIDQAEELLTRTGVREQQAFLSLLDEALGDDSPVWVVATVRSEFLSTAPERAGLAEVVDDPLVIEPLSRARLPMVIQQPAQRAGLQFAPGLVEQMVEETTGGDALPLLAYTAAGAVPAGRGRWPCHRCRVRGVGRGSRRPAAVAPTGSPTSWAGAAAASWCCPP